MHLPITSTKYDSFEESITCFCSFCFNDCFHDLWHSIDELLGFFNGISLPRMLQSIFPHSHGSFLVSILFSPFQVFLRSLKLNCELSFCRLKIVAPRRISVFRAILKRNVPVKLRLPKDSSLHQDKSKHRSPT